MTTEALRTLSRAHGALAWAAAAALAVAVIAVWRRRASGGALAALAAALGAAAFATGALLHVPFQVKLRQKLFLASASLGWLFERKEHAAFGALALALCGAAALGAERASRRAGDTAADTLRRAGILALAGALAFEALALGVSIAAAGRVRF